MQQRSPRARTQCARRILWDNGFPTSTRVELASSMLGDSTKATICERKNHARSQQKVCKLKSL